jgi:hypothetical protein
MSLRQPFLLLFLLPVTAAPLLAQGKTSLFSAPITVSSGVENVPGPEGALVPETSLLIKPLRPLFAKDTPRTTLRMSYAPEFEFVRNGTSNLTFWNHAADFAYGHTTGHRTRFTIGHSFVRTSDPLRLFQDSLFVLSRNSFRQNATVVAARHDLTRRTSIGTRFDNTLTRISSADGLDGTYLNGYGVAGTVSLTRHLTQRQKFTGSYSVLKFSPYRFPVDVDPDIFLSTLPTVRAGISRFALTIGLSSAEAATTPSGMLGGSRMGSPAGAPGVLDAPIAPGIGAPVIGPIAAVNSWNTSGPVSEGLLSPPAIPPGNSPAGPLVSTSLHAAFGQTRRTVTLTEDSVSSPPTKNLLGDPFHVAVGTYTYQTGPGLIFEVSGGAMTDRDVSYLMGGQIEKTSDRLWMSLGFHHFLSLYGHMPVRGVETTFGSLQPPGTRARSDYSAVTATIDGKITRNTELGISASVSRSTANFVEHHIRSLVGSARINHWLTDRFGLFATVDSVAEDRVQPGTRAFNRQRYFAGIQIRMSPPRSARKSE